MKKLFITWLIWLPFSNAAAQFTIYTPNGSTVPNVTIKHRNDTCGDCSGQRLR